MSEVSEAAEPRSAARRALGGFGALWGVGGIVVLISSAILRLGPIGIDALGYSLTAAQWAAILVWVPFMVFSEGYRGFHRAFSPRVAARALYLRRHPTLLRVLLAPAFCMGFFYSTKRRKIGATGMTVGIVTLVVLVRRLPQPWRGIVDLGVVLGLVVGVASLLYFAVRAFAGEGFDHPPEVPEGAPR